MDALNQYLFGTEYQRICDRCPGAYWTIVPSPSSSHRNIWWCNHCMPSITPPRKSEDALNRRRTYLR